MTPEAPLTPSALGKTVQLTVIGVVFVGVGSLLNAHVPAFHRPVVWVERELRRAGGALSQLPGTGLIFKNNPLTENKTMTEFLAVNIMETVLIGGAMTSIGAVLKAGNLRSHHMDSLFQTMAFTHK